MSETPIHKVQFVDIATGKHVPKLTYNEIRDELIRLAQDYMKLKREMKDNAISFARYIHSEASDYDNLEQKTHTVSEHYDYWLQITSRVD